MTYLKTITITDGRVTIPIAVRREWGFPKKVMIWSKDGKIIIAPISNIQARSRLPSAIIF